MSTAYCGPVIDIWMRPPTPGFLTTPMLRDKERVKKNWAARGWSPSAVLDSESLAETIQEMDASHVVLGVVPVRRGGRFGDVPNSDVQKLVQDYPGRFLGFGAPTLEDIEAGTRECGELLQQPEFAGIVIETGMWTPPRLVDSRDLYPFYELCRQHAKPIMLTVGGNGGPDISFCSSEPVRRVAGDFPDLKIIVQHGGWPNVGEALNLAYRHNNVILSPDVYLLGMFGWRDYIDAAHGFLSERILFGSGFPFTPYDHALRWLGAHLDAKAASRLFFENACAVLGIAPAAAVPEAGISA